MKIVVEERPAWRAKTIVGPLQLRRALRQVGWMGDLKTYMTTAPEEIQEAWEYATEIPRLDPLVLAVQTQFQKTDQEMDQLFELAQTF